MADRIASASSLYDRMPVAERLALVTHVFTSVHVGWACFSGRHFTPPMSQNMLERCLSRLRGRGWHMGHLRGSLEYVLLPAQTAPFVLSGTNKWDSITAHINQHGYITYTHLHEAGLKHETIRRWEETALGYGYKRLTGHQGAKAVLWRDWQKRTAPRVTVTEMHDYYARVGKDERLTVGGYGEPHWQTAVLTAMAREPQRYGARAVMARFYQACRAEGIACPGESVEGGD